MSDTKTTSTTGAITTTTSSHNSGEDVTYALRNEIGVAAKMEVGSGSITIATAGTQVTAAVTFPMAFVKTPQVVLVSITAAGSDAGYNSLQAASPTATGFTLKANSYAAQTISYSYIAIGV